MAQTGEHDGTTQQGPVGILLSNLGTPTAPTTGAVRAYLAEFLSDRRVVEAPRVVWWLALHGVILRIRPRRSAGLYRKVWTDAGSPLLAISKRQLAALRARLDACFDDGVRIELGMRYGEPSLRRALRALRAEGVRRLLVMALYPQYSATTTASTFDAVAEELRNWRRLPELRFVNGYHDHEGYVGALSATVRQAWAERAFSGRMLFSFHGLPKRYVQAGDPYLGQCHATAQRVAGDLGLSEEQWTVSFQSRVGREEWLKPYTDELLAQWGRDGVDGVDVICPGFSADCLETLEEIGIGARDIFLRAGGKSFRYVPALNDQPRHIDALADLALAKTADWRARPCL